MKNTTPAKKAISMLLAIILFSAIIPSCFAAGSSSIKPGDIVVFGSYEQDGKTNNGNEALEWIVLESNGLNALLITRYVIDCALYNDVRGDVTWEDCYLRQWLNEDFADEAFTSAEYSSIYESHVYADMNPDYSTDPGYDTEDKVFLLSVNEVYDYFDSNSERNCMATTYAIKRGAQVNKEKGGCWWWLRTPGKNAREAAYVIGGGSAYGKSAPVKSKYGGVRPVIRVSISAISSTTQSGIKSGSTSSKVSSTSPKVTLNSKVVDYMYSSWGEIHAAYPKLEPEFLNAGKYYVQIPGTKLELWFQNFNWSAESGDRCIGVCGPLSQLADNMPKTTKLSSFSEGFGTATRPKNGKANSYSLAECVSVSDYFICDWCAKVSFQGQSSAGKSFSGVLEIAVEDEDVNGGNTQLSSSCFARLTKK